MAKTLLVELLFFETLQYPLDFELFLLGFLVFDVQVVLDVEPQKAQGEQSNECVEPDNLIYACYVLIELSLPIRIFTTVNRHQIVRNDPYDSEGCESFYAEKVKLTSF